jgi:hypothetical protein
MVEMMVMMMTMTTKPDVCYPNDNFHRHDDRRLILGDYYLCLMLLLLLLLTLLVFRQMETDGTDDRT